MTQCARVTAVKYLGGRRLEVVFTDGLSRHLDFHTDWFGNTAQLNHDDFLARVFVDPVAHRLRLVKRDWFRSGCIARRS